MKIGMILDDIFPPDGRVENEAVSLIDQGHEVFLFCLGFNKEASESETINGIYVRRHIINLTFLKKIAALAYTVPLYEWYFTSVIKKFILHNNIEALHIHDMVIAETVMNLNDASYKLPVVLDLHENRPVIMEHYGFTRTFMGKLLIDLKKWRKKQKKLMKRADNVILVTEEAKKEAIYDTGLEENKFYVVPNTINPEIFYNYPVSQEIIEKYRNKFNILYLGDTGLRRGLDTAINAIPILIHEIPELKLVIVGKSREDAVLKARAHNLNISDYVVFEGWQDLKLFPSYIQASQVCISPLKRNLHHDTTYANKIFQYMALGKPLLVSDCPSQANVIKQVNAGLVHEANNEKDFADKLIFLYKNPEKRKQFGENGIEAIKTLYNWNNTSKNLLALYDHIGKNFKPA